MHRYNVNLQISNFHCQECGAVTPLPRPAKTRTREVGHVKHIWCYKCKDTTAHDEQREQDHKKHWPEMERESVELNETI